MREALNAPPNAGQMGRAVDFDNLERSAHSQIPVSIRQRPEVKIVNARPDRDSPDLGIPSTNNTMAEGLSWNTNLTGLKPLDLQGAS
ncbi:MAG: hypothetical protein O3B01_19100 [Planctomycetota bacterium]|nr:hypothetical protein [Planctomycetota bacterium]MDA1140680.1 hypothetical protein [Planctomycetota bacterium]